MGCLFLLCGLPPTPSWLAYAECGWCDAFYPTRKELVQWFEMTNETLLLLWDPRLTTGIIPRWNFMQWLHSNTSFSFGWTSTRALLLKMIIRVWWILWDRPYTITNGKLILLKRQTLASLQTSTKSSSLTSVGLQQAYRFLYQVGNQSRFFFWHTDIHVLPPSTTRKTQCTNRCFWQPHESKSSVIIFSGHVPLETSFGSLTSGWSPQLILIAFFGGLGC